MIVLIFCMAFKVIILSIGRVRGWKCSQGVVVFSGLDGGSVHLGQLWI